MIWFLHLSKMLTLCCTDGLLMKFLAFGNMWCTQLRLPQRLWLWGEIKPSCLHTCPHELMLSYLTDLPKNYCIINPIPSHTYVPIQDTLACVVDTKHHILDNGTHRAGVVVQVMSFRLHSLAPPGWHPHSQTCRPPPSRDGPFKSWLRPFDIGTLRAFIHLALWNNTVDDIPKLLKPCLIKLTKHSSNHFHACCHIPLPQATKRQAIQSCWLAISDDFLINVLCCVVGPNRSNFMNWWAQSLSQSFLHLNQPDSDSQLPCSYS